MSCIARDRLHTLEEEQNVEPGHPLDYARYCYNSCGPVREVNGAECKSLADGNFSGGDMPEEPTGWTPADAYGKKDTHGDSSSDSVVEQADSDDEKGIENVTWDMRKIMAERIRAEAGASVARSTFSGEQVKLHKHAIERTTKLLDKIEKATKESAKDFGPDLLLSKNNATAAGESAKETFNILKKAQAKLRTVGPDTQQSTKKMIAEAAAEPLKVEAASYVRRMGLDRPAGTYPRVMTNRAADSYVTAVSNSVARGDQYDRSSEDLAEKARDLQVQMDAAEHDADKLSASGDRIGASIKRRAARALRHQVEDLEGTAEKYAGTAEAARNTAQKWSTAAYDVTARIAYLHGQAITKTPAPLPIMEVPPPMALLSR